jgi:hypothetical protein
VKVTGSVARKVLDCPRRQCTLSPSTPSSMSFSPTTCYRFRTRPTRQI